MALKDKFILNQKIWNAHCFYIIFLHEFFEAPSYCLLSSAEGHRNIPFMIWILFNFRLAEALPIEYISPDNINYLVSSFSVLDLPQVSQQKTI